MSTETLAILDGIFKDDPPRVIQTLDGPVQVANICETLKLSTQPQPRRNRRTTETENMANKRQKSADGLGKCAFIEALFAKGGLTMQQICDQTVAAFPGSDPAKTLATIKVRPYIKRRNGKTAEWIHEPRKHRAAALVAPGTAAPQDGTAAAPEITPRQRKGKKAGIKREGKFQFIKEAIAAKQFTRAEIVAAVTAKFPNWSPELVQCGIFAARSQMRKAAQDDSIDWLPAVENAGTPAAVPAVTAPETPAAPQDAEPVHITQPTVAAAA